LAVSAFALALPGCYRHVIRAEGPTAEDEYRVYKPNDGPLFEEPEKDAPKTTRPRSSGIQ